MRYLNVDLVDKKGNKHGGLVSSDGQDLWITAEGHVVKISLVKTGKWEMKSKDLPEAEEPAEVEDVGPAELDS